MSTKPMLSVPKLIQHLLDKGIKFNIMSINDATEYLSINNNFFKLTSYRKNYEKYTDGINAGKYLDLEFAYLIELARIDVEVRHILLKMCLDIEHFLKVNLISFIEAQVNSNTGEDGYRVVTDFLAANTKYTNFMSNKSKNRNNPYCGGLISKYQSNMPIWALVEITTFGELLDIIDFCVKQYSMTLPVDRSCLDRVRQIRNATAHNNCIINDLRTAKVSCKTPQFITAFVQCAGVSTSSRKKRLSNRRVNQIIHLFYAYNKVVQSENTRTHRLDELHNLLDNRFLEYKNYFAKNTMLVSSYNLFEKISRIL